MSARAFWSAKEHKVHAGDPADHLHGPNCGCPSVKHLGQHVDYLFNGHAHHAHEGHWDECAPEVFETQPSTTH